MKKAIVIFGSEIDLGGAGVPMEYDLLIEGATYAKAKDVNGNNQPFTITASHIDSAVKQFAQRKQRAPMRDLVVDYEHQTLKGGEAPAAGWINNLSSIVRDGKKVLRAHMREWTDKATKYLQDHEYKYTSPVFALNATDKVTGEVYPCMIFNAALTNEPLIDELQPIAASQLYQTIFGKDTLMDGVIKKLCAFLGIAESADEQTVAAKFAEFATNVKTALAATTEIAAKDVLEYIAGAKTEIAAKAGLVKVICAKDGATVEEASAIYLAAKENAATVQTLHAEIDALKNKEINTQVDTIIAKGVADGKITPATRDSMHAFAAKDIKAFETYLASAPVVLPIGRLPEGGDTIAAKNITVEDRAIGKKLGVTEDQLVKYNKVE
ncbi:MAG: phage protease [Bacteroidota bacterium]|jgi:phage I-like protein